MDWDWAKFEGSAPALRYARRDLETVDRVLAITPGREIAVQAGGNLGIFPKYLARHFAAVYAFEPDQDLFLSMCRNAPEQNIVRFQAALGCERAMLGTRRARRDGSSKIAHEGVTHVVPGGIVPTLKVDDLGLTRCDLLYLDLEGFELFALNGAVETIARCRPVIAVEINAHCRHYGVTEEIVHGLIARMDYSNAFGLHSDEVFVPKERTDEA